MIPANDPIWNLPEGFSALRGDVGSILKERRKASRMKQSAVAADARITTESLSRIENRVGGRLPKLETVAALLDVLGLEWEDVAVAVRPDAISQRAVVRSDARETTYREDTIHGLGPQIREARRAAEKSLRALASECGMSAAQLSRVERGLSGDSRIFKDAEGWVNEPRGDRLVVIGNEVLARLVRRSS